MVNKEIKGAISSIYHSSLIAHHLRLNIFIARFLVCVALSATLAGYAIIGGWVATPKAETRADISLKPALVIQNGHTREVNSIAFSPDGKVLASGSFDNSIKLWDISTGRLIRSLEKHGAVCALAFSLGGILAAGGYKTIRVWEINSGRLLVSISDAHSRDVTSVAFRPDGAVLASGSNDNTIKLWDMETGRLRKTIITHPAYVHAVAFSPDGRLLAAGGEDFTVKLWNARTGERLQTLAGHSGVVEALAFRPDGRFLLSGSADGSIKMWEVKTGRLWATLEGHAGPVLSLSYKKDGRYLASGGEDGFIETWDMSTGRVFWSVKGHDAWVRSVAFSPDGTMLASGSWDKTVKLWDANTGRAIRCFREHSFVINSIAMRRDGRVLATGGNDNNIKLWDMKTGRSLGLLKRHEDKVTTIAFSPDGSLLASGSDDNSINIWDGTTGRLLRTIIGHPGSVFSISFSPDGSLLASDGGDKTVKLWDVKTGQCVKTLESHQDTVFAVSFSPAGGGILASGSQDKTVRLWDVKTGSVLMNLAGHSARVNSVTFSPNGKLLASTSEDDTIRLWDTGNGRLLKTIEGRALSVSFSPNGALLATGGPDGEVKLWDARTGQGVKTIEGHTGSVNSVVFSPDGRLLISGGKDTTIKLLDVKNGNNIMTLLPIETDDWVAYAPEGYYDATPDGERFVGWTMGTRNYPLDLFSGEFFLPGLFSIVINGEGIAHKRDIRRGLSRPPEVTIESPVSGAVTNMPTVNVVLNVTDTGGGVGDIRLYRQERLVGCAHNSAVIGAGKSKTFTFPARLIAGENVFRATAFSRDNIEAWGESARIGGSVTAKKPNLYIVAVGIDKYIIPSYSLKYSRPDVMGILKYFAGRSGGLFERVYQRSLLDTEATRTNIISSLKISVGTEDAAVIYLSGRCRLVSGKYYFLPQDAPDATEQAVARFGVSCDEIIKALGELQANNVLLILDAHNSGDTDASPLGKAEKEKAARWISKSAGVHVLLFSEGAGPSEPQAAGYDLFTYAIIGGLCGKADSNGDHVVRVSELLNYVHKELPGMARRFGSEQFAYTNLSGDDFPLSVY